MNFNSAQIELAAELAAHRQIFDFMLRALAASVASQEDPAAPPADRRTLVAAVRLLRGESLTLGVLDGVPATVERTANARFRAVIEQLSTAVEQRLAAPSI